jgi:nucleoid DNA-binding protein
MTKAELIARVASRKDLPRDITKKALAQIVDSVFTEIGDYFIRARVSRTSAARLSYPGFGTFTKRRRGPRMVRNPQNGSPIAIPSQSTVAFVPSQDLKRLLNDTVRATTRKTA